MGKIGIKDFPGHQLCRGDSREVSWNPVHSGEICP